MGPLGGYRFIELAGIGPSQLCGMLFADMGATVLRISPIHKADTGTAIPAHANIMNRGRQNIRVDLKHENGRALVLDLCERADALFEGFRPGVAERLGVGPEDCFARNDALVYGRISGWGQSGPLAHDVGHDANYLAIAGALNAIGEKSRLSVLPLNLVADFGGGALYLAMGMLAAILESRRSGKGQVVDAAMVDGVANMMTLFHGMHSVGLWQTGREQNLLDGGAPFYRCYETADDNQIVVGAIESRFFRALLEKLGIDSIDPSQQYDTSLWPAHREILAAEFKKRSRDEWVAHFAASEACVSPVLTMVEAREHSHNVERQVFTEIDGIVQPGPAPRFSRTESKATSVINHQKSAAILEEWQIARDEAERLLSAGHVGDSA